MEMTWLTSIEDRLKGVTAGPWTHYHSEILRPGVDSDSGLICTTSKVEGEENCDDLIFIAHSREDIPRLLEALKIAMGALEFYAHSGNYSEESIKICTRAIAALQKIEKGEF